MANLSRDLKDYLSKGDSNTSLFRFDGIQSPPQLSKWFAGNSYERVPTESSDSWFSHDNENSSSDSFLPSLSKKQRIVGFFAFILMGILCMSLASLYIPFLLLKARKFALLYSLGSLFLVSSFSMLWGPLSHLKHLFSMDRLPFTASYFGTMIGTLYFAMVVQSTPLTVICALAQIVALFWYISSYIPGGQTGLKFFTKIFSSVVTKTVTRTLPV